MYLYYYWKPTGIFNKTKNEFFNTDHNSNPSNEGSWGQYCITDKRSWWYQPRLQCRRFDDYSGSHRSSRLNWRVCSPRSQWWEVAIHWFCFVGTITFRAQITCIMFLQLTWHPSVLSIIYYIIHEFYEFSSILITFPIQCLSDIMTTVTTLLFL